jgi:hypothetical protein
MFACTTGVYPKGCGHHNNRVDCGPTQANTRLTFKTYYGQTLAVLQLHK